MHSVVFIANTQAISINSILPHCIPSRKNIQPFMNAPNLLIYLLYVATHPSKHSHFCHSNFLNMLPTILNIKHHRSCTRPIEIFLHRNWNWSLKNHFTLNHPNLICGSYLRSHNLKEWSWIAKMKTPRVFVDHSFYTRSF